MFTRADWNHQRPYFESKQQGSLEFYTLTVLFHAILHVQMEGTILCADEGLRPLLQEGIRQNNRDGRFCLQGILYYSMSCVQYVIT